MGSVYAAGRPMVYSKLLLCTVTFVIMTVPVSIFLPLKMAEQKLLNDCAQNLDMSLFKYCTRFIVWLRS